MFVKQSTNNVNKEEVCIYFLIKCLNKSFFSFRLESTNRILEKYGTKEKILAVKNERIKLEREEKQLKNEIKESEALLKQYETLNPDLLKEFQSLKNELESMQWAMKELNRVSLGSSIASTSPSNSPI